ncbi:MAG TPA: hypothetical protein VFY45_08280, partial [Baekduia sp.]|nr:hypothetical protein [Baekduia sp.]
GSDPRQSQGRISSNAVVYAGPAEINTNAQIVARARNPNQRQREHLIELSKLLQARGVDLVVPTKASTPPRPWAGCSSRSSARSQNSSTP